MMSQLKKINLILLGLISSTFAFTALAANPITYKSPTCGCCNEWVEHMNDHGFTIETVDTQDLNRIKKQYGIDHQLASCHTTIIDDYVFEGHIPADDIKRFLKEKPQLTGLAVPGMPIGSPGMEYGDRKDPYQVIGFSETGMPTIYSSHHQK